MAARPLSNARLAVMLHDNNWHLHMVATDYRTLDLIETKPFVEPNRVERGLQPHRASMFFPGKAKGVFKQCRTEATIDEHWINKDGYNLSGNSFAEANDARVQFRDYDGP